jgi:uncharacterized protein YkwD
MKTSIRFATTLCIIALVSTMAPVFAHATILAQATSTSSNNSCWKYKASEKGFAHKMNAERVLQGVGKLHLDPELSKAARKHTTEMWKADSLYHTPSNKLRHRVTNWVIIGENVGVGGTVDSLHQAFMDSPAHRDNILLSTFRNVGVGVAQKNGRMWVTVIFEGVSNPGTPLSMPSC